MVSGESAASTSVTFAARIVTVHDSPVVKLPAGSMVYAVGPPVAVAAWVPLAAQAIVNQLPFTFTGSLKVIVTFASVATPLTPLAGDVELTLGAWSALACGAGAATTKSTELLSVS